MVKHGAIITIVALLVFPLDEARTQTVSCDNHGNIVDPSYRGGLPCVGTLSVTSANAVISPQPYTLVLRDKLGKTVLIRGILLNGTYTSIGSGTFSAKESPEEICERIAAVLRASPDIEAADCFK